MFVISQCLWVRNLAQCSLCIVIEVQARAVVSSEGSVLKLTQVAVGEIPFLVGGQPEGLMPLLHQGQASLVPRHAGVSPT